MKRSLSLNLVIAMSLVLAGNSYAQNGPTAEFSDELKKTIEESARARKSKKAKKPSNPASQPEQKAEAKPSKPQPQQKAQSKPKKAPEKVATAPKSSSEKIKIQGALKNALSAFDLINKSTQKSASPKSNDRSHAPKLDPEVKGQSLPNSTTPAS